MSTNPKTAQHLSLMESLLQDLGVAPKSAERRNIAIEIRKALAVMSRTSSAIGEALTKLGKHKEMLLSLLQDAYERGPKAKPFDRGQAWSEIEYVAISQYQSRQHRKQTMGAADRKAKLREIADVLTQARSLIENAMQSPEIGSALMDAWQKWTEVPTISDLAHVYREFPHELEEAIKLVAVLEEVADRAATRIRVRHGPRSGRSVLDTFSVYWLAHIYQTYTGSKPGAGEGPFERFVGAYVKAIGLHIVDASLIDIIKATRRGARRRHSESTPSPFED